MCSYHWKVQMHQTCACEYTLSHMAIIGCNSPRFPLLCTMCQKPSWSERCHFQTTGGKAMKVHMRKWGKRKEQILGNSLWTIVSLGPNLIVSWGHIKIKTVYAILHEKRFFVGNKIVSCHGQKPGVKILKLLQQEKWLGIFFYRAETRLKKAHLIHHIHFVN